MVYSLHFRSFSLFLQIVCQVMCRGCGHPGDYHHNYKRILSDYGYKIQEAVVKDAPLSTQHKDLFIHAQLS